MTSTTTHTLTTGQQYDTDRLALMGWTAGDGTGHEGYSCWDYFDAEGRYKGPDQHGIEPIFGRPLDTYCLDCGDEGPTTLQPHRGVYLCAACYAIDMQPADDAADDEA